MKFTLTLAIALIAFTSSAVAQNHGTINFKAQIIQLTAYRTRLEDGKRWIIADGKQDGKLYSITVVVTPDITTAGTFKIDASHTATLTISNTDYSHAQNYCFDGGGSITVNQQNQQFAASATDLQPGDCFGARSGTDKLTFTIKP